MAGKIVAICLEKKAPGLPGLARRGSRKRPDPPGEATGWGLGTTRWSLGRAPSASLPERVIPQRRLAAISQGQLGKPAGRTLKSVVVRVVRADVQPLIAVPNYAGVRVVSGIVVGVSRR